MAELIRINRAVETIEVRDEDGEVACSWKVRTDDESLERTLRMVGNAMDRFAALNDEMAQAETDEERQKAAETMVRLFKRTITAIIGEQGWHDVLAYIGDGEECDPAANISNLGEVFAALTTWLWNHCSSKQLREAGVYFTAEKAKLPMNRKQRRAKKKGK
ncbi:hypothetical protein [uncultured Senegalimassilia sp.]|jgi:hypothetical protein|uniref:hypothetical protein n=1 Tax=uncultured Senegalimassilia sp. TaxID=1714350 RepID=UPI00206F5B3B|nr:hypothetical protein [uncultured Senegalimassilia sp.]DAG14719.1 MAG TPA: hypothetical protein [Caudoviricetes sp.]